MAIRICKRNPFCQQWPLLVILMQACMNSCSFQMLVGPYKNLSFPLISSAAMFEDFHIESNHF